MYIYIYICIYIYIYVYILQCIERNLNNQTESPDIVVAKPITTSPPPSHISILVKCKIALKPRIRRNSVRSSKFS